MFFKKVLIINIESKIWRIISLAKKLFGLKIEYIMIFNVKNKTPKLKHIFLN